jgi:hypothetical protein
MTQLTRKEQFEKERALYLELQRSSVFFVQKMWGLVPQEVKPEYKAEFEYICSLEWQEWEEAKDLVVADWFGDYDERNHRYDWYNFEKGKHISWQQYLILLSVDKAVQGKAKKKVSIASGHGIGKTGSISWIVLWFLFGRYQSQVPCTAPTANQMYDVLWKELSIWIAKMPKNISCAYEWNKDYIRMKEQPNTWFARAKTSSKENSEALAGVHADDVLTIADEASGVEEQIFNVAEGAWTSGNILVILISNPTRTSGYFYETHHKHKSNWQRFSFSSIESPLVDPTYESKIAERHSRDSEEYGIRVLGRFPKEDNMDDSGFIPLISERDVSIYPKMTETTYKNTSILGVDPAGEGDDKTVFVIRDQLKMEKLYEESISNTKGIAERIITYIEEYQLDPANVVIDNFGVGANVATEVAVASKGKYHITGINVGEDCDTEEEREQYENKRAFMFYAGLRNWLRQGGMMIEDNGFKDEVLSLKYKRNIRGKIIIMSKLLMKKKYAIKSPNIADAAGLTFLRNIQKYDRATAQLIQESEDMSGFDPSNIADFY